MALKTCEYSKCGEEFDPGSRPKKRFCTRSCLQKASSRKTRLENPRLHMYYKCLQRSQQRGWEFNLTREDIPEIPIHCPVFPWVKLVSPSGKGNKFYPDAPTVDRIDNNKGYVKGNIRIICWQANAMKNSGGSKEIFALLKDVLEIEGFLEKSS